MLSKFKTRKYNSARLEEYKARMNDPRDGGYNDPIMCSVLKQQDYSWGVDNASYYHPDELYKKLARYSPDKATSVSLDTKSWERAIAATFKMYARPKHIAQLKALRTPDELYQAIHAEKSAGLPSMGTKEDDFWYAINRRRQVLANIKIPQPCIAYTRTQLGEKVRLVWGYPHEVTLMEASFAKPLIDTFLVRNTSMASGKSKFEIGALVGMIDQQYGETLGLDFSQFDSTIPAELIYTAFNILETWFSEEDREECGWKQIVRYFIHTPIVMPNGKLYLGKKHGVPSGSFFTQLIDSIVNTMVQFWLAGELGYALSGEKFLVLGDDVIISIPKEISLESISRKVAGIGMVINPDKTVKGPHFLGANWVKGIPYRELDEILKRMHYIEKPRRQYPSIDYGDRKFLAYSLMMQYSAAYCNVFDMIAKIFPNNDVGRIDEIPSVFNDMYKVPEWDDKYTPGVLKHVGQSTKGISLLSARLLA